ncbi:tyrosine-type recombinase/integrase [Metabacillus sp. BG109]|uniref:Tyrosine-type recombinase/integrase n=2 Tax=Metabacillus bambusae TaxID=2795218 RepID=A0ABS3NAL5_9BACI|nr:tyrosine-type recombinase/integrase [Metabacillus bambusae]
MKLIRLASLNDKLAAIFEKHKEFQPITIHGFRHTHASILFEAGASIKDVQVRLGHTDIQTTMNIYTHVTNTAKEKVTNLFKSYMDL